MHFPLWITGDYITEREHLSVDVRVMQLLEQTFADYMRYDEQPINAGFSVWSYLSPISIIYSAREKEARRLRKPFTLKETPGKHSCEVRDG